MASTEIPPGKPFLPPPLYSVTGGSPRPRTDPANLPVPMFLVSLQDEIQRSHRREAFWMSVLVHLVALVAFINGTKLLPAPPVLVPTQTEVLQNHEYTFLVLPPDLQKSVAPPNSGLLSDKNRIATSRQPIIDRKTLQHILASSGKAPAKSKPHQFPAKISPELNSGPSSPRVMTEAAAAPAPSHIRTGQPEVESVAANPGTALPAPAQQGSGGLTGTPLGLSGSRGGGASQVGLSANTSQAASESVVDVVSDTMGVDFGPYLSRVLRSVRVNWYSRIPESARAPLMKKGKVSIQFDILKSGQIAGMELVGTSGDASLDGAALGGINQSGPFPPLPAQFQGQYLALRFHFFYNPDTNDLR